MKVIIVNDKDEVLDTVSRPDSELRDGTILEGKRFDGRWVRREFSDEVRDALSRELWRVFVRGGDV